MHCPALSAMLQQLAQLHPEAYLSAGVLRNTVWAHLHGQVFDRKTSDVDVIYYDVTKHDHSREQQLPSA